MQLRSVPIVLTAALLGCNGSQPAPNGEQEPTGAGTVALTAPAPDGGAVHIVRMVARGDQYAFEPDEVTVRPGDVVRFVQTGHLPEAVAFDPEAAPGGGLDFLQRQNLLHGPLLTEPGVFYDVAFLEAPPGEYGFFSVPHRQHRMNGRVVVTGEP
jgi:plastocyanin